MMRFETAIEHLVDNYRYAKSKVWIRDEVAWALYHTWKETDHKTEPSGYKTKPVNDEPQTETQTETQNSNLTFEKDECAKEYEELGLKELKELIKADRKTEPTAYADGYADGQRDERERWERMADHKDEPMHDLRTETHSCVKDTHNKTDGGE